MAFCLVGGSNKCAHLLHIRNCDRRTEPKLKGLLSFETNSTGNHKNPMLLGYLLTLVPNSLMVIPCATSGHISAHSSVGIHQHGQTLNA